MENQEECADGIEAFLRRVWQTAPHPLYAVFDGGLYDDLPGLLADEGLHAQPLFRAEDDPAAARAGPSLVALADEAAVQAAARAAARCGRAPVIWSWREPQESLVRHLRTINLAMIPREDGQPPLRLDPAAMPLPKHESVVFRHWDGNVLEPLWPLLSDPQRAKILGRALSVIWSSDEYAAAHASGPAPPVEPEPGFLRFTHWQMQRLSEARLGASHRAVARYLRRTEPEATASIDDPELLSFVRRADAQGRAYGIRSERSHGLWAWFVLVTGGAALTEPKIQAAFFESGLTGDETVEALINGMIAHERSGASWTG